MAPSGPLLQSDADFDKALDIFHEIIGCEDVAKKLALLYKLSMSTQKADARRLPIGGWCAATFILPNDSLTPCVSVSLMHPKMWRVRIIVRHAFSFSSLNLTTRSQQEREFDVVPDIGSASMAHACPTLAVRKCLLFMTPAPSQPATKSRLGLTSRSPVDITETSCWSSMLDSTG